VETPIAVALITGSITAIGWLSTHTLTARRERARARAEATLHHVERQLEELYGPLVFLIYEGRRTFEDLLQTLGRTYVFRESESLPPNELKTWIFWAENALLPRNDRIKQLLMAKTHLIEGGVFPPSYVAFLDHHNSWVVNHERWKKEQVPYSWHSRINWPETFESEVIGTFQYLKAKHARLLTQLEGHS